MAISRNDIDYIPVCHEQAGAMAADSYARLSENIVAHSSASVRYFIDP